MICESSSCTSGPCVSCYTLREWDAGWFLIESLVPEVGHEYCLLGREKDFSERCFPLGHLVSFPLFLPKGQAIPYGLACSCRSCACQCLGLLTYPVELVSSAPPWRCSMDPWPESNLDRAPWCFVLQGLQLPCYLKARRSFSWSCVVGSSGW